MDDISNIQKLELQFLTLSNNLLSKCTIAESFIYQWIEILEEDFQLSEVYFYLPSLHGRKVYASHGVLEDRHKAKMNTIFEDETIIDDYYFCPIENLGKKAFFAINEDHIRSDIFKIFKKHVSFYIFQISKLDEFYKKSQITNFNLFLKDFLLKPSTMNDLIENTSQYLNNDHAFLYSINDKKYHGNNTTQEIIEEYQNNFDFILKQTISNRFCYQNEDFHHKVKSLILYPIFTEDDLQYVLGSFSNHNTIIQTSDLHMMADFACSGLLIKYIKENI